MVDNAECLSVMYIIRIYKVFLFLDFTDSKLCIHNDNYYNHVPQALVNWTEFILFRSFDLIVFKEFDFPKFSHTCCFALPNIANYNPSSLLNIPMLNIRPCLIENLCSLPFQMFKRIYLVCLSKETVVVIIIVRYL